MPHPLIELGGSGRLVVLLPANGFPPETYHAALEPLLADYRVVSLPPRALWDDAGPPPAEPGNWVTLAEDLLVGMRIHGLPRGIVVGHSFGGVAALLGAVREPARFEALALLDPTILPPEVMAGLEQQRRRGEAETRPLVRSALTRRDAFASTAEAFEYWRDKPLFSDWSDAALLEYSRAMLTPLPSGGFTLRWPRAWEAHYYASIQTDTWETLEQLDAAIPMLLARGARSDTFVPEAAELFLAKVPWARPRMLPGGHLFPHAAPAETGRVLADWLSSLPAA